MLPVTISMDDLLGREKAGALPHAVDGGGAQSSYDVGDIGYWSPSHSLAIYYRKDGSTIPSPGIVMMGTIDSGLTQSRVLGRSSSRSKRCPKCCMSGCLRKAFRFLDRATRCIAPRSPRVARCRERVRAPE
jgi:hypothetical protein